MSHVDEGELTAYADGAYSAADADAQRIEAHITTCVNCRNRLAQAQSLSARAAEVLATAAPLNVNVPPFDDVRAAARRKSFALPAVPLTWAATVLIALGIGWFGHDALVNPDATRSILQSERGVAAAAEEAVTEPTAATVPRPEVAVPADEARTVRRQSEAQGAAAGRELAVSEEKLEVEPAAPPPSAPPAVAAAKVAAAAPERSEAFADMLVNPVEYITPAEAEKRGLRLHIVPELEVLRVGLRGNEVEVEQKLPDGVIVTVTASEPVIADLRKQRAATGEALARREVAMDAAAVTVTRGTLGIKIVAPLSQDSLRALAAKVK